LTHARTERILRTDVRRNKAWEAEVEESNKAREAHVEERIGSVEDRIGRVEGRIDELERMKNLGPISAARLRAIGIASPEALIQMGAIEAYVRLKRAFPTVTTQIALYALHGAVTNVRWYTLSDEIKAALRDAADRRS